MVRWHTGEEYIDPHRTIGSELSQSDPEERVGDPESLPPKGEAEAEDLDRDLAVAGANARADVRLKASSAWRSS